MRDCLVFPFNEDPFVIQVDEFLGSVKVKCSNGDYQDRRVGKFEITEPGHATVYLFAHGYDSPPSRAHIKQIIEKLKPKSI